MSANQPGRNNPPVATQTRDDKRRVQDVPGCIKYIILLFLLLLLFGEIYAGEFRRFPELPTIFWLILFIKLLLILLLLILIWVQRRLNCDLTAPSGCTKAEYDSATDKWFIRVKGTASGTVFGHYTLAVERPPGTPFAATISYPSGGASGTAPVISGDLGRIDVTYIEPGPMRVILTVYPVGSGSPCVHANNFDWANRDFYIEKIGVVPAQIMGPHPADATEVLKLIKYTPSPADPDASVAESISVEGGADFTGCGREMVEYVLQFRRVNFGSLPWQQDAPAPGDWTNINLPLPYGDPAHPRTFLWLFGTWYNAIRHGRITRVWSIGNFLMSISPWITAPRPYTAEQPWDTLGAGLNGRFTVRLIVRHQPTVGPPDVPTPELYDSATVWIDNRQIEGFIHHLGIAGGGSLNVCDELSLSQFITPDPHSSSGPFSKVNATINGRAWDPIILNSYPHTDHPNDNFHRYVLNFQKDGSGGPWPIGTSGARVPATLQEAPLAAPPADIGMLSSWDIVGALDAGPPTGGLAPDPKIFRGERCAYLLHLVVTDTTHRGDGGEVHTAEHYFPFCIMNDIPDKVPFPVP
jgi:hypothetical protein